MTFERGVGLTNACGTGMLASALALLHGGRVEAGQTLSIVNPGGFVNVRLAGPDAATMEGNATYTHRVRIDFDPVAARLTGVAITHTYEEEIAAYEAIVRHAKRLAGTGTPQFSISPSRHL